MLFERKITRGIMGALVVAAFAVGFVALELAGSPQSAAQSPAQSPAQSSTQAAAQSPAQAAPDWQAAAGGKMSFDVASVKRNLAGSAPNGNAAQRVPFSGGPSGAVSGGFLSEEDLPVGDYVAFAYKLTADERNSVTYPKWAMAEHFDIQARGPAGATTDQMRLMMQSLLADRFGLAVHWSERQVPAYSVVLVKPGKTGPNLQPYSGNPCIAGSAASGNCAGAGYKSLPDGEIQTAGRNEPIERFVVSLKFLPHAGIDRPLVDGTGLSGGFDYTLTWLPDPQPGASTQPGLEGPSFLEALRDQLGLKLVPTTTAGRSLAIDSIHEPSPN